MTISDTFLGAAFGSWTGAATAVGLTVSTIHDRAGFAVLRPDWDRLAGLVTGLPYADHAYLDAWFQTYGAALRPHIRIVRSDARLVGAVALCPGPMPFSRVPGAFDRIGLFAPLVDPTLADPGPVLAALLRPGHGRYQVLEPVDEADAFRICSAARVAGMPTRVQQVFTANSVDLAGGVEAWRGTLGKNARRALTRGAKGLDIPGARWVTSADGQDAAAAAFLQACAKSWKTDAGTGFAGSSAGSVFIRRLARNAPPGTLHFATLFHGDTPVGGTFSSIKGDVLYLNSVEFNETMAALGPGRFLMGRVIETAAAMGMRTVDLMRSGPLNQSLAKAERPLFRVILHRRADPTVHLRWIAGLRRRIARAGLSGLSPRARHQARTEASHEA